MATRLDPVSGWLKNESGEVVNLVDLLGGGTPVSDKVYPPSGPNSGLVIGSDGKVYDLTKLVGGAVAELPEPTETFHGRIFQYAGETTADMTHGHFYECVGDEGGYEWVEISLAADGRGLAATVVSETIAFT